MGKQRTTLRVGAPVADATEWESVDWTEARHQVRRLQVRIAKAVQENRWGKVKVLQYLVTRSRYAKLLAVQRVTSNKGKHTPGVDGVLWQGAGAKWQAADGLRRRGYQPQPLRRIYIPKKNGKKRPLSIPTMFDRAMQALYKLALAPVAETTADRNSYGFREGRGCHDAIAAAFNALSKPNSATWILEGDIDGCFDNISRPWMLSHIPTDGVVLGKWLQAGYVEDGILYPTHKGTPQGGVISPMLANMTLDGLEEAIRRAVPRQSRVNFVRYADDFIVTGKSRRLLEQCVKPAIEAFLAERGLTLSQEKTALTHIRKGFTFLGQTFRKHGRVLHITPPTEAVLALVRKLGTLIRTHVSAPMTDLIQKLNLTLRGWANYYRHVVSSDAFTRIDTYVYEQLWRMLHRRHPHRSKGWLIPRYWIAAGTQWRFAVRRKNDDGRKVVHSLLRLHSVGITRYVKVRAAANPYLPEHAAYFWQRRHRKHGKLLGALSARQFRAQFA